MTPDMTRRLEIAAMNIEEDFNNGIDGISDIGLTNHIFVRMVQAYQEGIKHTGRGFQDVDGLALQIIAALAKSAAETKPMPEFALEAAKAAVLRYAYYLPAPVDNQDAFKRATTFEDEEQGNGEPVVYGRDVGRDGLGGGLGRDFGITTPRTPEPPEGQPYAPRSGAQLFGELMLAMNGRYEMLEGIKWPPDWSPEEIENYIRYKRELEARHMAAGRKGI